MSVAAGDASPAAPWLLPPVRHRLLAPINLSRKLFFNHVHKCAGTSFIDFLRKLPTPSGWCEGLTAGNHTRARSDAALAEWWYEPSADCSVLALESPSLGELLVSMGRERARRVAANGTGAGDAQHEPQLLTMYRESVANASNPRRWRCG